MKQLVPMDDYGVFADSGDRARGYAAKQCGLVPTAG